MLLDTADRLMLCGQDTRDSTFVWLIFKCRPLKVLFLRFLNQAARRLMCTTQFSPEKLSEW